MLEELYLGSCICCHQLLLLAKLQGVVNSLPRLDSVSRRQLHLKMHGPDMTLLHVMLAWQCELR